MNKNKPNPYAFRLNEYIDSNIKSIIKKTGMNATLVARSIFNIGLNEIFKNGTDNTVKAPALYKFKPAYIKSCLIHKKTVKANFQLTENQMAYVLSDSFYEDFDASDGIRFLFTVGISVLKSEVLLLTDSIGGFSVAPPCVYKNLILQHAGDK